MAMDLNTAGFSMPLGASLYPPPPYEFRDAEQISLCFEADGAAVSALLPRGLVIDGVDGDPSRAYCEMRVCLYHWSAFGPFRETYILVRVCGHGDRPYYFLPLIFTDNEAPLAAGRELWGYPKKLARMTWDWGGAAKGGAMGEQMIFSVNRPASTPLFTAVFTPERQADTSERHGLPVVSHRYLPPSDASRAPAANELIELASPKHLQRDAAGNLKLWAGRGSITFHSTSELDPWHLFTPTLMKTSFWQISDFNLPYGRVIHDYLSE
jgi:acetoacetate decarboxylase